MNINLDTSLISLITAGLAFLASLIAAGVSIYNARFRRFVSEKWWHRKSEAYIKIIDDLAGSIVYLEDLYDALGQSAPKEIIQKMKQKRRDEYKSYLGIHTLRTEGLFIDEKVSEELNKLERVLSEIYENGYYDTQKEFVQIEAILNARRQALNTIVPIAKKDLRVG